MAEAKARYTRRELWRWVAWEHEYGPITLHERIDILFAQSDWLFAEANRNRKKRKRPFKVADFRQTWGSKPTRQKKTPDQLWAQMQNVAMLMGQGAKTRQ